MSSRSVTALSPREVPLDRPAPSFGEAPPARAARALAFTPTTTAAVVESPPQIGLAWLLRLRWGAVLGQLAALVFCARLIDAALPIRVLLGLSALTAATNAALSLWLRRGASSRGLVAAVLVLDVLILTGMLLASGGASNPFSVFYLVEVALAALLLDVRGTWCLAALTSLGFGSLFVLPSYAIDPHAAHHASALHLQGMWVAYTLAAFFVGHFGSKLAEALRRREQQVAVLERYAAQTEKLAALSTLAAGAAHELGTPLGTIAVVAKELAHALDRPGETRPLAEDARLIRQEVDRCRAVLQKLSARAGECAGEAPRRITAQAACEALRAELGERLAEELVIETRDPEAGFVAPVGMLSQVLVNLVRNAIDAQAQIGARGPVALALAVEGERVIFTIRDRGPGLSSEVLSRLGEPFFTTKPAGRGMGLGIYLAQAFAEKVGGELAFARREGGGTEARLSMPRDVLSAAVGA